ncbi:MAG TPA: cellulase family glycosylhydrolase [Bacillota bacterium]|nr:cellulase family glycosylhydrolase [Bacillota bacterium]
MNKHLKSVLFLSLNLLLVLLFVSCTKIPSNNNGRFRGVMSSNTATEADLKTLRFEWKANLIRCQLKQLNPKSPSDMSEYDAWLNDALYDLDRVLSYCKTYRIKVIIVLMSVPGGRNADQENLIFYNQTFHDKFISVWQKIASRYNQHPALLGYDLINEPTQLNSPPQGLDCLSTQLEAAEAIRIIDPITRIYIEVTNGDGPLGYSNFKPVNLPNVEYEVHMYEPHEFTHQQVNGNFLPVATYPGTINSIYYDQNQLKEILQPARDFQVKYGVRMYVGEFSAVRWAPGAAQYLKDCIDIFEEYGWDWSYHAYRNWTGWNLEHEDGTPNSASVLATVRTDRMNVVLAGLALNQ